MVDPVAFTVDFLRRGLPLPPGAVTGDLVGREPGQVTVYLVHHGGRRVVRHRADRVAIEYLILHPDRERAAGLAYLVRELLLEGMPGRSVPGALVLDVADVDTPKYLPDLISREHCYRAEVAITYIEEQPTA